MNGPHKKLELWKESMLFTRLIYQYCDSLPLDEKFGMISQLKRAAVSIPVNIAEGAARQTKKEFRQFLFVARGSLSEIDTLIELSINLGFVNKKDAELVIEKEGKVNALLNGLIKSLPS